MGFHERTKKTVVLLAALWAAISALSSALAEFSYRVREEEEEVVEEEDADADAAASPVAGGADAVAPREVAAESAEAPGDVGPRPMTVCRMPPAVTDCVSVLRTLRGEAPSDFALAF